LPPAFRMGSRGPIVRDLQGALGGLKTDGVFGEKTRFAIEKKQKQAGLETTGAADESIFARIGLAWPDEFRICLTLTNCFEGTDFGGCNLRDIDGAGLTFGCIGFTTASGEVQSLVGAFLRAVPEAMAAFAPARRTELEQLMESSAQRDAWERFIFGADGRVRNDARGALAAWGTHPAMQEAQLAAARANYWEPAIAYATLLGIRSMAGRGLMFDVWVQNGGWRAQHSKLLERAQQADLHRADGRKKLQTIAEVVAACANARWRGDVLARKMVFARGRGTVHGTRYELDAQGFGL
jgi:hypothetical protein